MQPSLQNPAWSPPGDAILLTAFRGGYNVAPADLLVFDVGSSMVRTLVAEGSGNVNLPGSSWNATTGQIVFSSSRPPHDEIFVIDASGAPGDERIVTTRVDQVAYEPTLSPDGLWVAFESHPLDVETQGVITKYRLDGSSAYLALTAAADDCRQPNWSPDGALILYQRFVGGRWTLWVMDPDGLSPREVSTGVGEATDGSFSPDGQWIVYSGDGPDVVYASLYVVSVTGGTPRRVTFAEAYDGAPSWSPDGRTIAFESASGDPDGTAGTTLWVIDAPAL